jgi:hypothetical protein
LLPVGWMPEKMRTDRHGIHALGAGAVRRVNNGAGAPLRLAFGVWGANDVEGAGAGSRSQAGLGGDNGRVALATPTPIPSVRRFQSHLLTGCAERVSGRPDVGGAALRALGG